MSQLWAHTPNGYGSWHKLADHLRSTAERSRQFAAAMCPEAGALAYQAGLWHDLGKAHPQFQQYLSDQAAGIGRRGEGGDHKGAGAVHILTTCDWLAFLIAGHHGGLPAGAELRSTLAEWRIAPHVAEALAYARAGLRDMIAPVEPLPLPGFVQASTSKTTRELFLRILFSCLVDADFLDTEAHFDSERSSARATPALDLARLWEYFSADQEALIAESSATPVNAAREEVYRAAVAAAARCAPGLFRLTVPTGGGKTRAGLGFGLRHALQHGLCRVIFAVPFTTITEQTASVYRAIFPHTPQAILEHHSAVQRHVEPANDSVGAELWRRLASENWDAPIVVTTTVQLFESLLAANPSACRKLHNVVGSVIVIDEAQTLPPRLLTPLLDVLRELIANYHVSVVFCTATQPAFEAIPGFADIAAATEIAPEPAGLFRRLHRVTYCWPKADEQMSWRDVASQMRRVSQALAIVNAKSDAAQLLDALDDPHATHLSTLLCGAHRRVVLARVREQLQSGEVCRLVATQVVEAGVDLDFPLVLRALGPLDAIVQAAGRCNREGRLPTPGRLIVFEPASGHLPPGTYRVAAGSARTLLAQGELDVDDPATFARFFALFYGAVDTDAKRVQLLRQALDYPTTARLTRMIDDDTVPVAVHYGPTGDDNSVDRLLARLRAVPHLARLILRDLQPFLVNIRRRHIQALAAQQLIREVVPELGVWEWLGVYDRVRGIQLHLDPDLVVI